MSPTNFGSVVSNGVFPDDAVADESWSTMTLFNGAAVAVNGVAPSYMKDAFNNVHLRGAMDVSYGALAGTIQIASVPVGFRPAAQVIKGYFGQPQGATWRIDIQTDGVITWFGTNSSAQYAARIVFNGTCYRAA